MRVRPASRNAKPACMNITRTAVTTTQTVETAINRSWFSATDLDLLEPAARAVVDDVADGRRPPEAVLRFVAATGRVDERVDHELLQPVIDDEDQQRLRQEPRLEDPSAVLVGDAQLTPVTDRLDDGHADVARRLLDGVDDGLDPLADHRRLYFHHLAPPLSCTTKRGLGSTSFVLPRPRCLRRPPASTTERPDTTESKVARSFEV